MPSVFAQNVRKLKTPNVFMQHSAQNVDRVNKDVTYMTGNHFAAGGCYVLVTAKRPRKVASYLRPWLRHYYG
jgi:hypothetical protein